jgi:uncharacterized protein
MNFARKYTDFILKYKYVVFLTTLLFTGFFTYHAIQVDTINALENMLPEHDPALIEFKKFNEEYGGDFLVMVAIESKQIFSHKMLSTVSEITDEIQKLPHIEDIYSLTNIEDLTSEDGGLTFTPLIEKPIPQDIKKLEAIKTKVQGDPVFNRYLTHPEEPITVLYIRLKNNDDLLKKQGSRNFIIPAVTNILEKHKKQIDFQYYFAGNAPLEYELDLSSQQTQIYSTISIILMMSVILFFLFRHRTGILLLLVTIGIAALWTNGFVNVTGRNLNFVTTMLPSLILIVAVLDCIHIYAIFRKQDQSLAPKERMVYTIDQVLVPCLLTSFTTMIGFSCLMLSDMEVIRDFGMFATFGIFCALFLSLGPYCILLTLIPQRNTKNRHSISPKLTKAAAAIASYNHHNWKASLVIFAFFTFIVGLAVTTLVVEDRPITHYDEDHRIRKSYLFFDEKFSGSTTIDFVIKGPDGSLKNPENLKSIDAFIEEYSGTSDEVSAPLSAILYLKKANQILHDGKPEFYKIPDDQATIAQLFFLLESNDNFSSFINQDYTSMRIHSRIKALGSRVGRISHNRIKAVIPKHIKSPLTAVSTGANVVWMNMEHYITRALIRSFAATLFLVTLIMAVLLRSFKWGLISMIPNVIPVVFNFGLMGVTGATLNLVTLMIASIAIGIAVDDTIHMTVHVKRGIAKGLSMDEALRKTFDEVGIAVITTSVILSLGFFTLTLSNFNPARQFGFFTGVTVLFALLSDLFLLPALLKLFEKSLTKKKKTKEDYALAG